MNEKAEITSEGGLVTRVLLRLMVRHNHHERKCENPFVLSLSKDDWQIRVLLMQTNRGLDGRGTGGREGWHAYLELLSDDELAVAFGDGPCPKSLPSDHQVYFR